MADVTQEIERLRPVYETGVLRLFRRERSMAYVALLRACFDPLTAELPRETLEDRLAQGIARLVDSGDWPAPGEGRTTADEAHRTLVELTREGEGDYAWLANTLDAASHRYLYRLTARAHRAIEALARLQEDTAVLSGAQANSIIMEIEHARMQLTADPRERIRLLNREIKERRREIKRLLGQDAAAALDQEQVGDIIAVVHNTLRGVSIDLRELALAERDNGDVLRRRMQAGAMDADAILASYHDGYRRSFRDSDAGRRFEDAFQVIVTDEGRQRIDEDVQAIAHSPYVEGNAGALLDQVRGELDRIYEGIEDVRRQRRASDEAVSRLVRQQTDTRYRTMMARLNRLYTAICDGIKAGGTGPEHAAAYMTDVSAALFPALPTRPSKPIRRADPPALRAAQAGTGAKASGDDLRRMIESGGPRLRRMAGLIRRAPVMRDGMVDMAASFNRLPADERRESELIGFLGGLDTAPDASGGTATWDCVGLDGRTRRWRTRILLADPAELDAIIEEE